MKMLEFLFVPTILFLTVVAPVWIVMHYRSLKGSSRGLDPDDVQSVEKMLETLDQMSERIEALESILQHDHPNWRQHVRSKNSKTETGS